MPDFIVTAYLGLLGMVLGSYLNVVAYRVPARLFQAHGMVNQGFSRQYLASSSARSQCPCCGYRLRWYHNIPVFSFIFLRGKCARCEQPISIQYPLIELLAGFAFIGCYWYAGLSSEWLALSIFILVSIPLVIIDLKHRLLPDSIVLVLAIAGFAFAFTGVLPVSITNSIAGALAAFGVSYGIAYLYKIVRKRDGLGLGDVKLMGAFGAWLGFAGALQAFYIAAAIMVLFCVVTLPVYIALRQKVSATMPFGPSLLFAGFFVLIGEYEGFSITTLLSG